MKFLNNLLVKARNNNSRIDLWNKNLFRLVAWNVNSLAMNWKLWDIDSIFISIEGLKAEVGKSNIGVT